MRALRLPLLIVGALMALAGLIWIGQGTGLFPYPKQSFMIDQMPWAYRGIFVAIAGLVLVFVSRRLQLRFIEQTKLSADRKEDFRGLGDLMSGQDVSERPSSKIGARGVVRAPMNFVDAPPEARRVERVREPDGTSHHPLRAQMLEIHNGRDLSPSASLGREGFELIAHKTALRNYRDDEELKRVYLPEMAELVRRVTGADQVAMTPGVGKRVTDAAVRASVKETRVLEGAHFVHLDYSAASVPDFLDRAIEGSGIDPKRYSRIVTYNLWRALSPPPQNMPLALCDMRTTSPDDLVVANAEFADNQFRFEISLVRHRPSHRWFYYPDMTADELLMFKVWTLRPAWEPAVFHGAFYDPSCPKSAPPRVSIEARAFAFFQ